MTPATVSRKSTVPAAAAGLTVAVSVTVPPDGELDAGLATSEVVVAVGPAGSVVW